MTSPLHALFVDDACAEVEELDRAMRAADQELVVGVARGEQQLAQALEVQRWDAVLCTSSTVAAVRQKGDVAVVVVLHGSDERELAAALEAGADEVVELGQAARLRRVLTREVELRALRARLAEGAELVLLGRIARGVSHDLNNLLTILTCSAQSLHSDYPANENVAAITSGTAVASRLVFQLAQLHRHHPQSLPAIELAVLIGELMPLLEAAVRGRGVTWRIDLAPSDSMLVTAHPGQVQQVVLNLALNARDAMSEGGTITISARPAAFDEAEAEAWDLARPGDYVVLSVADDGVGMGDDTRAQMFLPHFTTKEGGENGRGVGLSCVLQVVEQHGGALRVRSSPGHGTEVQVALPRATTETERDISTEPPLARCGGSTAPPAMETCA